MKSSEFITEGIFDIFKKKPTLTQLDQLRVGSVKKLCGFDISKLPMDKQKIIHDKVLRFAGFPGTVSAWVDVAKIRSNEDNFEEEYDEGHDELDYPEKYDPVNDFSKPSSASTKKEILDFRITALNIIQQYLAQVRGILTDHSDNLSLIDVEYNNCNTDLYRLHDEFFKEHFKSYYK